MFAGHRTACLFRIWIDERTRRDRLTDGDPGLSDQCKIRGYSTQWESHSWSCTAKQLLRPALSRIIPALHLDVPIIVNRCACHFQSLVRLQFFTLLWSVPKIMLSLSRSPDLLFLLCYLYIFQAKSGNWSYARFLRENWQTIKNAATASKNFNSTI